MRYFSVPSKESHEAQILPACFGKAYGPIGGVSVGDAAMLAVRGVDHVELDGECLAIAPETASWAFLTGAEHRLFKELDGKTFGWLLAQGLAGRDAAAEFVARLFRRGLLSVDGISSISHDVLADSHNTPDSHLVELLLTEKCNLACGYCLAGTGKDMPTMTPEIARKTIDLAFAMDQATTLTFEFSGGEPFLQFELMRTLVDYIESHPGRQGRSVYLTAQTNGSLLDERRVQWLLEHDVQLGVSLDGDPSSHDVSRPQLNGKGSFGRVISGIDLLQRAQVPFGTLVVLNRSNIGSVEALVDFLLDNGITCLKLNPVSYLGTARGAWDEVGITSGEAIEYFERFAQLLVQRGFLLLEDNLRTMLDHVVSKCRPSRCLRGLCGAGESFQAISARGDIYPCGRATQSPGLVLGNVLTEGRDLAAPGRSHTLIREIRLRRPQDLDGCATCHYRQLCQAGCAVQAYERYGTVRHRTPECFFYKTMYPLLMRWLAFDPQALDHFSRAGYFGAGAVPYARDFFGESA